MEVVRFNRARYVSWLVVPLLVAGGPLLSVQGSVPLAGTVVEGVSVPGIALGATRTEVIAAYGSPSFCQGPTQDFCTYTLVGTGSVNVRYRGSDGGEATGTGDDVLYNVHWSGYPQWITTAGVTTALALADPGAVTNAYPDGSVTYNFLNDIFRVSDPGQGIQVQWNYNLYSGTVHTAMSIVAATAPPAPALFIEQSAANSITLRWPESAGGMVLESAADMSSGGTWQPVTSPTPVLTDGQFVLTLPMDAGARIFRLAPSP